MVKVYSTMGINFRGLGSYHKIHEILHTTKFNTRTVYTEHIFIGYFSYWSSGIALQSYFLVQCVQLVVPLFRFKIFLYIISLHSTVTL